MVLTGAVSVDHLAGDVGVTGMPCSFLDHVQDDESQRRRPLLRRNLIVEIRTHPDLIGALARHPVGRNEVMQRLMAGSDEPRPLRISREIDRPSGEDAVEPPTFDPREMTDELGN